MSTRSKKSTGGSFKEASFSNKETTKSSPRVSSSPGPGNRPSSPTFLSRLQEKNELACLNDRLASFIERVRQLETENSRLSLIINTQDESVNKENTKVKYMFEEELRSARSLIDSTSKDKAKVQMENASLRSELDEVRTKYKNKEMDVVMLEKKVLGLESLGAELSGKLDDAKNQRRYREEECNKLKKEMEILGQNLEVLKKSLEEETLTRVDLENKLQSLEEDAIFKAKLYQQEIDESLSRSRVRMEEVDSKVQEELESKLQESMVQMRMENEENLKMMRIEVEEVYQRKLADLRDAVTKSEGMSEKNSIEMRSIRKRNEEQMADINRLNNLISGYELRIRELENQLKLEKDGHLASCEALNSQIKRLKETIEEQMLEYKDLMDMKIKLDLEISAYRKMLDNEENRLKIQTTKARFSSPSVEGNRKRKRIDLESSSSSEVSLPADSSFVSMEISISGKYSGIVKFDEVAADGSFVRIINSSSDKELSIGGWQLKMTSDLSEVTFKFHRTLIIKPSSTITVWSSSSEHSHSPPTDLLMKGQNWLLSDTNKMSLIDQKGEIICDAELKRTIREGKVGTNGTAAPVLPSSQNNSSIKSEHDSSLNGSKSGKKWIAFLTFLS